MSKSLIISALGANVAQPAFEEAEIENAMSDAEIVQSVAESTADEAEINELTEAAKVGEERAGGLEDLAATAERITEANQNEIVLTEIAGELATAGTGASLATTKDEDGNEVGLESLVGRAYSPEAIKSIKEMAKRIWERVRAIVDRIWDKIVAYYRKITDQTKSVIKSAKKVQERAETLAAATLKENSDKVDLTSVAASLSVGEKVPSNYGDLTKGLETLDKHCGWVLEGLPKVTMNVGGELKKTLGNFKIEKSAESLDAVNKAWSGIPNVAEKHLKVSVNKDSRFASSAKVSASEPLLGNRAIYMSMIPADGDGALTVSQANRSLSLKVAMVSDKDIKSPKDVSVTTASVADCSKLAEKVIMLAEKVAKFEADYLRKLEKLRGDVKKSTEGVQKSVTDDTAYADVKNWGSAMAYNTAFAGIATSLPTGFTSLLMTSCRSVLVACDKSLANYKKA